MTDTSEHRTVHTVQMLRAVAALAVVYFHCTAPRGGFDLPQTGRWGVDIFFVISGFIIAKVVTGDSRYFLRKRLIRVVPLYILATFAAAFAAVLFKRLINSTDVSVGNLILSLLFVPFKMSTRDGPILEVGWTLSYEMFFYLVMGGALLFSACIFSKANQSRGALLLAVSILSVIPLSAWAIPSSVYAIKFFQNTLLYEFLAGIVIFLVWNRRSSVRRPDARGRSVLSACCGLLVISGFTAMIVYDLRPDLQFDRAVSYGIPAAVIVAASLSFEPSIRQRRFSSFAVVLGDASYGMYLFHPFIVLGLSRVVFASLSVERASTVVKLALTSTALAIAIIFSIALYRVIDRPIQVRLRRMLVGGSR